MHEVMRSDQFSVNLADNHKNIDVLLEDLKQKQIALTLKFGKIFLNDPDIGGRYSALLDGGRKVMRIKFSKDFIRGLKKIISVI